MFARIRQTSRRLQVSVVETRWASGHSGQEHVAALGSIAA
jgi:hypothetical protein